MKNFLVSNEGFLKAFASAQQLAKKTNGRIATMADLAVLRTKTGINDLLWNMWAMTATTIYFGSYKGERLIVVAHHFGPLTTEERVIAWTSSGEFKKGDDRQVSGLKGCPTITQNEFDKLVEGAYGEVKTIKFDEYYPVHKEELTGYEIKVDRAAQDPLLEALLGRDRASYEAYLQKCFSISKDYAREERKEEGAEEKILQLSIEDMYGASIFNIYNKTVEFPETPIAFMMLFQRPNRYGNRDLSISTELHTEESIKGYQQFIVLNDEEDGLVRIGFNVQKHWKKCLVPNIEEFKETFFSLTGGIDGKTLFVEYPKSTDGAWMDTGECMFPVSDVVAIGDPTTFTTKDCMFFLKYHIDEVRKLAPKGANAYTITGDVQGRDTVTVPIQFYSVTPLTEKRVLREEEVMDNLNLLLEINNILIPA
jgi:hypothetical protein